MLKGQFNFGPILIQFRSNFGPIWTKNLQSLYFQGEGRFSFGTGNRTGDVYQGQFHGGEFHGNGTYLYANGDKFEGKFRFGKKNGKGIFYVSDGETIPGRWRNDKLVAEVRFF